MLMRDACWASGIVGLALLLGAPAGAVTLDFDALSHGDVVSTQFAGVSIVADNLNNDVDLAVAFDSRIPSDLGRMQDLIATPGGPPFWSGGNLQDEALNILLVLQKNGAGCEDSVCDRPDDEGRRPAGSLGFVFDTPILSFGLDVVDIESPDDEPGSLEFFHAGGSSSIDFLDLIAIGDFGNRTANRINPVDAEDLGLAPGTSFTQVTIHLGGSGAVDNIRFALVPEPGSAGLLGVGLALLGARAGRHRRPRG